MDAIRRSIIDGIVVEKVNLVRATMNEAYEVKDNLLEDGLDYKKIIVDLSTCDYIDSTFLGALVYSYRKIKENDGIIVLVVGDTFLSTSFMFREISSIFQVYLTLNEAKAQLKTYNKEFVAERC